MAVHTNARHIEATPATSEEKLILREHEVKAGFGFWPAASVSGGLNKLIYSEPENPLPALTGIHKPAWYLRACCVQVLFWVPRMYRGTK